MFIRNIVHSSLFMFWSYYTLIPFGCNLSQLSN